MDKQLPSRPNLDHLRKQAKALLAALAEGDTQAIATFQAHLPAAAAMTPATIQSAGFRLADAQSAIARSTGFASWPALARHVEQLRALEGTWAIERLEVDGADVPPAAVARARLLIDGDRFRFESQTAPFEGVFTIDVEAEPHRIDIELVEGPQAGEWNRGIFRLDGDTLALCLDLNGEPHPTEFRAPAGSGHGFEVLRRVAAARPAAVTGGTRQPAAPVVETAPEATADAFAYVASPLAEKLQGAWVARAIVRDGAELPDYILAGARRVADGNHLRITVGGQTAIEALTRLDETASPVAVDYLLLRGAAKGRIVRGVLAWHGDEVAFCMGTPGGERPADFTAPAGSGRTLSRWAKQP